MGHEFSIDVTELHMFSGYEWLDFGDPCDHDCEHRGQSTIGWGPNLSTYELVKCDDCQCRAWVDGRWQQTRQRGQSPRFWAERMAWRKVPSDG
jgi:hypothetical protein